MKTNPARELAEILESWTPESGRHTALQQRTTAINEEGYSEAFWTGINHAVALLDEYRRIVNTLPERDAARHRSQLQELHGLVYVPDLSWRAPAEQSSEWSNAAQAIKMLQFAADSLDKFLPDELRQSEADTIAGSLQEALRLTAETLPEGMEREHLSRTILLAIQFAEDVNRFSSDAVRVATGAVITDLWPVTEDDDVPPETRRRLKEICRDLFYGVSTNVAATYVVNGLNLGAEVIKAISA